MSYLRWPHGGRDDHLADPETARHDHELQAECTDIVASLGMSEVIAESAGQTTATADTDSAQRSLNACLACVAHASGCRIQRVTMRMPPSWPTGLTLTNAAHDLAVIIRPPGNGLYPRQIELHELGHIAFKDWHDASPDTALNGLRSMLPDLPDAMLSQALGRSTYGDRCERRAELWATLVASLFLRPLRPRRQPSPESSPLINRRLHAAFGISGTEWPTARS
jgi:hypothetical protein